MVVVYASSLAVGFVALLVIVMGGTLAENLGRADRDPGMRIGQRGRLIVGSVLGFGIGGMAAEFSPLGLSWPVALAAALVAALLAVLWVRYATGSGAGA
ncbi:MAG: hypothetical protein ACFCU2_06520 [Acidimicrobiia bacterium]